MMKSTLITLMLLVAVKSGAQEQNIDQHWYSVPNEDLITLETLEGNVVFALSERLAPKHVQRFKALTAQGFFNDQFFYRVVDGFVAQGGSNGNHSEDTRNSGTLDAEFVVKPSKDVVVIEHNDMFAPATGFLVGFPVGLDTERNEMWGLHCPGTVAFARDVAKDTASTEFYAVIGQAPRHLDRNMSVIGKVVSGMPVLQSLLRGNMENAGVLDVMEEKNKIISATIGADRPIFIQKTSHPEYEKRINTGRNLDNPFFHDNIFGPRAIDVCYHQLKVTSTPW
ncbi:peptidylprolyl isomerase [Alteromonas sp. KUL49]|uniref:peptidylprolyl isomerase n=1 Tax=Alteromonas sp. KUL49 TaxID=2480798 RepID=UPI001F5EDBCD|nr:peptidylprolyl isomerase [Alteromonas sp. KUL49]